MLTAADLQRFNGSYTFYRHFTGMVYTEGVKYLADEGGAHWLIDAIASYQRDRKLKALPWWPEFQLWYLDVAQGSRPAELPVSPTGSIGDANLRDMAAAIKAGHRVAVLTCREDSDKYATVIQGIPYTDFPIDGRTKLYVEGNTILLPDEH